MTSVEQLVKRQMDRWDLQARASRERGGAAVQDVIPRPFIALSRERGADGMAIARELSERLGWTLLDQQLADYVAEHSHIRRMLFERVDERAQGRIENIVKGILQGDAPDARDYARHLGMTLHVFLLHDPAIIVGRGAHILLNDFAEFGLRVRLIAPTEWRVRHLAATEGLSEEKAREEIRRSDADQASFIRDAYDREITNPLLYDLTLNRESLGAAATVKTILDAARDKGII